MWHRNFARGNAALVPGHCLSFYFGAKRLGGETSSEGESSSGGETTRVKTTGDVLCEWVGAGAKRIGEEMVWGRNDPEPSTRQPYQQPHRQFRRLEIPFPLRKIVPDYSKYFRNEKRSSINQVLNSNKVALSTQVTV